MCIGVFSQSVNLLCIGWQHGKCRYGILRGVCLLEDMSIVEQQPLS